MRSVAFKTSFGVLRTYRDVAQAGYFKPGKAVQLLTKTKLENMKREIEKLIQKQANLISKLKTIELPIQQNNCSTEVIPKQHDLDNLFTRTVGMAQNAKRQIDAIVPHEILKYAYLNCPKKLKEKQSKFE